MGLRARISVVWVPCGHPESVEVGQDGVLGVAMYVRYSSCAPSSCGYTCVSAAWQTDGTTPLYIASQNGRVKVVRALLGAGAVVNKSWVRDDGVADRVRLFVGDSF